MFRTLAGVVLTFVAIGTVLHPADPARAPAAEPSAKPSRTELSYIPADAAIFLHLDAARLWNGPLLKGFREADPKTSGELAAGLFMLFGSSPESVETLTIYWPKFQSPEDFASFAVIGVFKTPYEKANLEAGLKNIAVPNSKITVLAPTKQMAIMLVGLDAETYGKPQAAKNGPQTAAIAEAARHLFSIGLAPGQFPDEIRGDNLPQEVRALQPLFFAESVAAFIDFDKELTVDVRVKASTPPRAKEVEKSLGFLATTAGEFLGQGLKELRRDAVKDRDAQDLIAILAAFQSGLKDAKFSTEGETTRAVAKAPTDLPFARASMAAKRKVQEAAARSQSANNLKQIAIAYHNYANVNDPFFPPAAVCDKTGKPMLSWRVLILPFIEEDALYKQFKLDEPWDGPNNKKLIAKMPKVYVVPGSPNPKPNETHYRLFVGNGAAHDYLKGARLPADFADGTSNTILAATAKDSVIWSKPDELDFDPDKDMTKLLGFFPGNACQVAFVDGSVRSLSLSLSKKTLNAYITRGGGEVTDDE